MRARRFSPALPGGCLCASLPPLSLFPLYDAMPDGRRQESVDRRRSHPWCRCHLFVVAAAGHIDAQEEGGDRHGAGWASPCVSSPRRVSSRARALLPGGPPSVPFSSIPEIDEAHPAVVSQGTLLTPLLVLAMGKGEALLVHAGALHDACWWCMPRKRQRGRQACNRTRVERGRGRLAAATAAPPTVLCVSPPPGRLGWSGKLTVLLVQLTIPACARPLYAHARACQRTNSVTGFATRRLRTQRPAPRGPSKDERVVGWRRSGVVFRHVVVFMDSCAIAVLYVLCVADGHIATFLCCAPSRDGHAMALSHFEYVCCCEPLAPATTHSVSGRRLRAPPPRREIEHLGIGRGQR